MTFSDALKRFRKEHRLTQKDVALKLGVQESAYQRYEQGRSLPSIAVVTKIADAYGVSIDYLVGRSDDPNPEKKTKSADISAAMVEHIRQKAYDSVDEEIQRLFPSITLPQRESHNGLILQP